MAPRYWLIASSRKTPHPDLDNHALWGFHDEQEARSWLEEIRSLYTDWDFVGPEPVTIENLDIDKEVDFGGQEFLERARSLS